MKEYSDVIGLGVLFVVNGVAALMSFCDYFEKKKLVRQLEAAPSFNNGVELSQLFDKTGQQTIPYALVQGRVLATDSPMSAADGSEGVFQHFTVVQHEKVRHMGGNWSDESTVVQKHAKSINFGLIQPFHPPGDEPLDGSAWVVHNVNRNIPEGVFLQLSTNTMHHYDPTEQVLSMREGDRITAAIEKTEKFIRNYATITLSGKITRDETGFIQLNPPSRGDLFVVHSGTIQEVIESHKAIQDILGCIGIVTGSLVLCLGGAIAYKVWKLTRRPKTSGDSSSSRPRRY